MIILVCNRPEDPGNPVSKRSSDHEIWSRIPCGVCLVGNPACFVMHGRGSPEGASSSVGLDPLLFRPLANPGISLPVGTCSVQTTESHSLACVYSLTAHHLQVGTCAGDRSVVGVVVYPSRSLLHPHDHLPSVQNLGRAGACSSATPPGETQYLGTHGALYFLSRAEILDSRYPFHDDSHLMFLKGN